MRNRMMFLVQYADLDGWEQTLGVFDSRDAADAAAGAYWAQNYPLARPWQDAKVLRVVPVPLNTLDW